MRDVVSVFEQLITQERFRARLKESKSEYQSQKGPVWGFLNSAFGLFLLSSVLLAGLGRLYTDYQSTLEARRTRAQETIKLITEFDYRTGLMEYYARRLAEPNMPADDRRGHGVLTWRAVIGHSDFQPAFPEFRNTHWLAIAGRLELLVPDERADEIGSTIFDIENGKASEWLYKSELLARQSELLRNYVRRIKKHYVEKMRM